MKYAVIGDLHFYEHIYDVSENACKFILDTIEKENPNFVVFLGDLFENKDRIPNKLLDLASDLFFTLSKKQTVYYIIGNHDIGTEEYTAPFLKHVVKRIEKPEFIVDEFTFVFVPFYRSINKMLSDIKKISNYIHYIKKDTSKRLQK